MSLKQQKFEQNDKKARKRHEVTLSATPKATSNANEKETDLSVSFVAHVEPTEKAIEAKKERKKKYDQQILEENKAVIVEATAIEAAPTVEEAPVDVEIAAPVEAEVAKEAETVVEAAEEVQAVEEPVVVVAAEEDEDAEKAEKTESRFKKLFSRKPVEAAPVYACAYGKVDHKLEHCESSANSRFRVSLETRKALSGWIFVLPFVLGILFIYGPMVINSIAISFSEVSLKNELTWNSFANYSYIFNSDEWFATTLVDGIKDLILQIPAIVIFALFMAIILNQKMTGRAVFRAIFFLPVILSTGIIDSYDTQSKFMESINNSQGGVDDNTGAESGGMLSAMDLQQLLGGIKIATELVDYVVGLVNDIFNIVSRSGVQMLIFLSGLQSISPSIYESCEVEGASAWETFWKITLPMISPMILVNAVYTVIDAFTSADNRVMLYIAKILGSDTPNGKGVAGAMTWVYIGVVLVFILLVALIMKTVVFYQKKD